MISADETCAWSFDEFEMNETCWTTGVNRRLLDKLVSIIAIFVLETEEVTQQKKRKQGSNNFTGYSQW